MHNILFTTYSDFPSPRTGGSNRIIYDILEGLDYNRFHPFYLSYDLNIDVSNFRIIADFKKYLSNQKKTTNYLYKNLYFYKFLTTRKVYLNYHFRKRENYFIDKAANYRNFPVIHSHHPVSGFYYKDCKGKKILTIHSKRSFVYEMINSAGIQKYSHTLINSLKDKEVTAFNSSDVITFPSEAGKDMFLEYYSPRLSRDKDIRVIRNGIDLEKISHISAHKNILSCYGLSGNYDIKILNVANHIKQKNIKLLIEAINILVNGMGKKALLVNIGCGPLTYELKKLVNSYSLETNIKFLGTVPNEDVIKMMKIFDYFVIASEDVVFDLVILEALASGCCVIASNSGGNKEIIQNDINGYLFDNSNANEIVKLILTADKSKINDNIFSSVRNYSLGNMTHNYEKLYLDKN